MLTVWTYQFGKLDETNSDKNSCPFVLFLCQDSNAGKGQWTISLKAKLLHGKSCAVFVFEAQTIASAVLTEREPSWQNAGLETWVELLCHQRLSCSQRDMYHDIHLHQTFLIPSPREPSSSWYPPSSDIFKIPIPDLGWGVVKQQHRKHEGLLCHQRLFCYQLLYPTLH